MDSKPNLHSNLASESALNSKGLGGTAIKKMKK